MGLEGEMVDTTLGDVAAAADQVAEDQKQVARMARTMQRQRDRGWSWAQILDRQRASGVVDLLRRSRHLITRTTTGLTVTLARQLSAEGETRREIARRLGITHQRVTTLLNHHHLE